MHLAKTVLLRTRHEDAGSLTILFAVLVPLLALFASVAVDYSRATSLQWSAQAALDSAVLAASDALLPDEQRQATYDALLAKNFDATDASSLVSRFTYSRADGGVGTLSFKYSSGLLHMAGFDFANVTVRSAARQDLFDLEVALVLDVSGSMQHGMGGSSRLAALQSAASRLINELDAARMPGQRISFAIVPFTMNVNIGTANAHLADDTTNPLFAGTTWAGCVMERPAPYHNQDVFNAGDARNGGRWQAYIWPPEPDSGGQCQNPSNGTNTGYRTVDVIGPGGDFDPWTKGPNYNCVRHPIVPLTSSVADALSKISELSSHPNMGTILAPGIAWGHRVLSPEAPFDEGAAFGNEVRKIMIVITDGEQTTEGEFVASPCSSETNTASAYRFDPATMKLDGRALADQGPRDMFSPYGYMLDSEPLGWATSWAEVKTKLSEVTLDACQEFKARSNGDKSVSLYTIAASSGAAPGTEVYDLLQRCATSERHFFFADDDTTLQDVFYTIAREATALRLTN